MRKRKEIVVKVMPTGDGAGGSIVTHYIPTWRVTLGKAAPYLLVFAILLVIGQAVFSIVQFSEMRELKSENHGLRTQIEAMDLEVDGLSQVVNRVEMFDSRLRKVTMLSDPERNLAIGPVGKPNTDSKAGEAGYSVAEMKKDLIGPGGTTQALALIQDRVKLLGEESSEVENSVRELEVYLEDQQALLASTPSLKPAKGWLTSSFGYRIDPYTGLRQMHAGIDIAANSGKEIIAPGDGLVTFASTRGAYGNVIIIDHGHNVTTLYGHLQEFAVKSGDKVKRGTLIGRIGNTGRSTGPHLHYEIRINGVPQNPDRFILE